MKNFEFKKSLGQNFLIDQNIIKKIISSINLKEDSLIIEIGPGAGALTKELIKLDANIVCYELDIRLKEYLEQLSAKNLEIFYIDFLKVDLRKILEAKKYKHLYFVSNLPYYITTTIINKIYKENAEEIIIMIQKEVADKFSSQFESKNKNSLNILLQYHYNFSKIINVSKNSFFPRPNVDSTVIKLEKRCSKEVLKNYAHFEKLVKDSFKYKRKNLKNNLKSYDLNKIEKTLKQYQKDLTNRAESLTVKEFVKISNDLN